MKKNSTLFFLMGLFIMTFFITACEEDNDDNNVPVFDVFNNNSESRDLIVVISDMHLGADPNYSEINKNRDTLAVFLEKVRTSRSVKELVVAGDLLDEWFVPATIDTYNGKDQADFVKRIAANNSEVIDKFNQIIQEGKILVTYVPGNHDMAISEDNVDLILPGINQARDSAGLGSYSPIGYPQIVIEHGNRYNIIAAPDPISNDSIAEGSILPVGYFFTRLALLHFIQGCEQSTDNIPLLQINETADYSQVLMYGYWMSWKWWLEMLPIENHFNEKMIVTNIDGFKDTLSVDDLLPYQEVPFGEIKVKLYNGIQDNWAERCNSNGVTVPISVEDAFLYSKSSTTGTDTMAVIQYFSNQQSNKRVVIFGHTHAAKINNYENCRGEKSVYANSGTWIDENPNGSKLNFIVITPQSDDEDSQTYVTLYNFEGEEENEMAKDSLRL